MNITMRTKLALGAISIVAALASAPPAVAGGCHTENRAIPPPSSTELIAMSCQHNAVAATQGNVAVTVNGAGGKTLSAALTAGVSARVDGLDSSGNVVGTCTRTDTTANGSSVSTAPADCGATVVKWSGFIVYNE